MKTLRLLVVTSCICLPMLVLANSAVQTVGVWHDIAAPEFKASLPGLATRKESTRRSAFGKLKKVGYGLKLGSGLTTRRWDITVTKLPRRMRKFPARDLIDASWRGSYGPVGTRPGPGKRPGKKITFKHKGRRYPGRRYTYAGPGFTKSSSVFYLIKGRMYALHYLRSKKADDEKLFDRAVAGFKPTP